MPMPAPHAEWTAEMVRALPDDGQRYEVIDGELVVSPSPSLLHQVTVGLLFDLLRPYAERVGLLAVFAPADVTFSPVRQVQPDLFVVPLHDGRRPRELADIRHLTLAAEVLSPATARLDRYTKRALYQSQGVEEYWIVDLPARLVERWRPSDEEPEVLLDQVTWQPVAAHAPLRIDLRRLFREAYGYQERDADASP
jgi:Uma2 family endonuclease